MTFSGDDGPVLLSMPPPPPPVVACGFVQPGLLLPHPMHMHSMQMQPTPPVAAHLVFPGQTLQPPPPMPAHPEECRVEVRYVWAVNLREELFHIHSLLPSYPGVCIDTMFPSTVHGSHTPRHLRPPRESYAVVKRHVDELCLLQLGLALFGPSGRCPVIWQFNFRGFDAGRDPHAASSIAMLRSQGMDFFMLREFGIDARVFAAEFFRFGLGCRGLTWAAFSGSYDFAYLAKVLGGGRPLPETLEGFLGPCPRPVRAGGARRRVHCQVLRRRQRRTRGLDQVAAALGVERVTCHKNTRQK